MTRSRFIIQQLLVGCILVLVSCESAVMRDFNTLMAGNNVPAAKQMLNERLSENPGDAEANYLMGNILMREKEYQQAITYFDRSLSSSSMYREHIEYMKERSYRIEINEANSAWVDERYYRTIQSLNQAKHIYPDRVELYRFLGIAYKQTEQMDEAKTSYRSCLNLEPNNVECGLNLAVLYQENGQYPEAIRLSHDFLDDDPENSGFIKTLAYAYLESGELDRAEEVFERLLEVSFRYLTLRQFANELNNMGEIYRAERYYRRCLEVRPLDQEVLNALSYIYMETGNFRLMVEANERLLLIDPDDDSVKKNLMLSYELYGDIDNYRALRSELGLD